MGMLKEFRDFAVRGNVVDLAVGLIMGAAFSPIVSTMVDNIIMPPIGYLLAGIDFSQLSSGFPAGAEKPDVEIKYGLFLNAVVKFAVTAFAVFLLVKMINTLRKPAAAPEPAAAPAPTPTEIYLKEIRDLLAGAK